MTVWVAQELTYGPKNFERWHTCPKCALDYPESKLVKYKGGYYCEDCVQDFVAADRKRVHLRGTF